MRLKCLGHYQFFPSRFPCAGRLFQAYRRLRPFLNAPKIHSGFQKLDQFYSKAVEFYFAPSGFASIFENHYYGRGAYQASPALTSGVALQLQIAPNWSASIEVVYFQRSFSADSVNVWPVISPNYSKVNLDLAFLEIPFAGQYYFSKGKIAPYIQAGLHLGVPIKRSLAEEQFRANADELEDQPKNSFIGPAFGYGGGLGLKLQLSEKMTLQLSGQFTKFATTLSSSSKAFESSGFEDRTPIDMPRIQAGGVLFFRL